jgi:hypothetical protein
MPFEEKSAWSYAAIAFVVPAVYFAVVLGRVPGADVGQIAYVRPLLIAIGAAMVLNMAAVIVTGASAPTGAGRRDERDSEINRRGERIGFYVMSVGVLIPFGLALAEAEQFWIANTIYLAFVLAALGSAIAKIVAYRRGF